MACLITTQCELYSMRLRPYTLAALVCLLICSVFSLEAVDPNHILYVMNQGDISTSIDLYKSYKSESECHDMELIQQLGYSILLHGSNSRDPEEQLLAMFGAGICGNEKAIGILNEGLKSSNPNFQLAAINLLSKFHSDPATEMINMMLTSPYLPIRLEAVYLLAKNQHPKAPGQIQALLQKVPPDVLPCFPELFAMCGDKNSIRSLHQMLSHPEESVRVQAIIQAAKYGRDDLIRDIRRISNHLNIAELEACCFSLGKFKDEQSANRLKQLSSSPTPTVSLAASFALYQLGREESKEQIVSMALNANLFAINLLGKISGSEPALSKLLGSNNHHVRINAALALLERNSPVAIEELKRLLIKDRRDLSFVKIQSPGKCLSAWKSIPSAKQNLASQPLKLELSLHFREQLLSQAIGLKEDDFLQIAHLVLANRQYDLVPALTHQLIQLQTPKAVELLKNYSRLVGSPLIRDYCTLALFRLREGESYREAVKSWVSSHHNHVMINFRPLVPYEMIDPEMTRHQLTPEETSRILVESFEALVQLQDQEAVDVLLDAICNGNPKNRFALAGLLIRAAH